MAEELKTLKDLDAHNVGWRLPDNISIEAVRIDDLKAEVIKWVKILENPMTWVEIRKMMKRSTIFNQYHTLVMAQFIMHFFNLTEEDLK